MPTNRCKSFNLKVRIGDGDKTEVIGGNQNSTRWTKRCRMQYLFEEEQTLKVDVYSETNWGKKCGKIENHKLVGIASCILGEIFHQPGIIYIQI